MSGTIQFTLMRENSCYPRVERFFQKIHFRLHSLLFCANLYLKMTFQETLFETCFNIMNWCWRISVLMVVLIINIVMIPLCILSTFCLRVCSFIVNCCIEPVLLRCCLDKIPLYKGSNKIYSLLKGFYNNKDGYFGHLLTINKKNLHLAPDPSFRMLDLMIEEASSIRFDFFTLKDCIVETFRSISDEDIDKYFSTYAEDIRSQANTSNLIFLNLKDVLHNLEYKEQYHTEEAPNDPKHIYVLLYQRKIFRVLQQFLEDPRISAKDKVLALIELSDVSGKCGPTWSAAIYSVMNNSYKQCLKEDMKNYINIKNELFDMIQDFKEKLLLELSLSFATSDWHIINQLKRSHGKDLGLHVQSLDMDAHLSYYGQHEAIALYDVFYSAYLKSSDQMILAIKERINDQNCSSQEFYEFLIEIVQSLGEEQFAQVCNQNYPFTREGLENFVLDHFVDDVLNMFFNDRAIAVLLTYIGVLK